MLMSMYGGRINLLILIVLKWVLLLAYKSHLIPMSYILDNLEGKLYIACYRVTLL